MAEVWLARFNGVGGFQKQVVLKTILPHLAEDPEFVKMFINEALLAARLNHPNIVQIFDLGRLERRYFIAMEHVPGRSFRQISRRRREQGELIPTWFTLRIIAAVCDGLYYAHEYCDEQGSPLCLVHRDVSPENVMVSFTGTTKILDFGVAKAITATSVTKAGTLKGKYSYISPEQVRGTRADRRSDIYAIGVILYEFLTGVRPFRGNNDLALLREIARGNPTPPRKIAPWISEELEHIILTALALNPDNRYDDAGKLGMDIIEYLRKSGDQVSQRDIGLYVSSLFPEEPSIPSDVMKRLVSAQSMEAHLKTPDPSVVASDPAALEPEIIEMELSKNGKETGAIEITGLEAWQGDDIPPMNRPREAKSKPKPKVRSTSGSFEAVGEAASAKEKPAAAKPTAAPKAKQLGSTEDQDTTQPRGSGGKLEAQTKAAGAASADADPAAHAASEPVQSQRIEGAARGQGDAIKPQAKPAELPKPSEKKGRGSWLQRIIRREPSSPPAEEKKELAAAAPSSTPPLPEAAQAPAEAKLKLKHKPGLINSVKTEESEIQFEQSLAGGSDPAARAEEGGPPEPQPGAPLDRSMTEQSIAAMPKPSTGSKVSSPILPKPSTAAKKQSVGIKPAVAPPLARPRMADRAPSPIPLPKPATVTAGSASSLPKPKASQAVTAAPSLPQPQTSRAATAAPTLPQPKTNRGATLPKPRTTKSGSSPSLPQPSTTKSSVSSPPRARSVFDTADQNVEKRSSQVANWYDRPSNEKASEQPEREIVGKGLKASPSREVADWFTRRQEAKEDSGDQEPNSPRRDRAAEAAGSLPAGVSTRSGGWDSSPKGPADFFGMKRPVVSSDDADVFTSHSIPRGWNPERQTFDELKSNVSKKAEEDMITRFREMGRQARSLASLVSQSKAEYVEKRGDGSADSNDTSLAVELAAVHFERGLANLRRGDYSGALREWEEALSQDPDNRVYHSNMKRLKDLIAALHS